MLFLGLDSHQGSSGSLHCEGRGHRRVRKHNATLMNEQGKYKEAIRTFNQEVKELKGKLEEADCQK